MTRFRSPLGWVGGKYWLTEHFSEIGPHIGDTLISPFLGGAVLELNLSYNYGVKVLGYDGNPDLINFWKHYLDEPVELMGTARKRLIMEERDDLNEEWRAYDPTYDFQRAALFYAVNKVSFQSSMNGLLKYTLEDGGIFYNGRRYNLEYAHLDKLAPVEMKVETADFTATFMKHPTEFMYLDPPYISWSAQSNYSASDRMYDGVFNHGELNELLKKRDNWILSYGHIPQIPYITLAYDGYYMRKYPKRSGWNQRRKYEGECELLIFSHDIAEKVRSQTLF